MQAGRRFIQNIEGTAGGPLGELPRQLDPLRLSPRQCRGGLAEFDITQADVVERGQFAADRGQVLEESQSLLDRHV